MHVPHTGAPYYSQQPAQPGNDQSAGAMMPMGMMWPPPQQQLPPGTTDQDAQYAQQPYGMPSGM